MKARRLLTAVAATVAAAAAMTPAAATESPTADSVGAGLWEATDSPPTEQDCGSFTLQDGFCVASDNFGGVELGVRFEVTESVLITGVRMYRADAGPLTASLWSTDGLRLADGVIPAVDTSFAPGWQDVAFESPVSVPTGTEFIASYYSPSATYAFTYDYFTSAYEAGPLVALESVEGSGNGVFCYDSGLGCDPDFNYPVGSFRDSNYWVSPLWQYPFQGFSAQVEEGGWVTAKAGRAIPVDFSLGGDYGLGILAEGYPKATRTICPSANVSSVELESTLTSTAGNSALSYDAQTGEYKYVWKTSKDAAKKCYEFQVGLVDGSVRSLNVEFVR
jgi:hypothetical protein